MVQFRCYAYGRGSQCDYAILKNTVDSTNSSCNLRIPAKPMTLVLDKTAFRHYTPKEMHDHLLKFDAFLFDKIATDFTVKKYFDNPLAQFSTEKVFPILHVIALLRDGHWIYFTAPFSRYARREGHRLVSENNNSEDCFGMNPILRLEVVTDPNLTSVADPRIAAKMLSEMQAGNEREEQARYTELAKNTERPAVLFSAPLAMLKKGMAQSYLGQRFTLYQHIIGAGHEYPEDGMFYIGITARDWKKRWAEHRAAIMRGSRLKFHRTYGDRVLERQLTYVHHKVMGVASTLERVQDLEEAFVAGHWEDTRLLNMIPGGRAGIQYLHEHGIMGKDVIRSPDQIEKALETWLRDHPRKGLPAPWIADQWKNDDYALKIICGPEGRLSIEQVMAIRIMASGGLSVDEIVRQSGAKNRLQVQRVIDGKTYSRVRNIGAN